MKHAFRLTPLVLLLASTAAVAQKPALEEVIVTAQKRDEVLQDVPISMTAYSASAMDAAAINTMVDLTEITPGVLILEGSGTATPYIRGVGARNITAGNESATAFYLDGVYMTDKSGVMMADFADTESLQVLRGPQGTLFGRNATAGAILITTKRPQQEFSGTIKATYGNEEHGGALFVTGGLTDTLSASLSAFGRWQDEYIKNLNPANGLGSKVGEEEAKAVRAKLLWEPVDTFSALLHLHYTDSVDGANMAQQTLKGAPLAIAEGLFGNTIPDIRSEERVYAGEIEPKIGYRGRGGALTLDWRTETFDIKSISAYHEDFGEIWLDLDGSPMPLFYFQTDLSSKVIQQELNISSNTDGPLTWMAGLYYIEYHDGYDKLDQNVGIPYPRDLAFLGSQVSGAAGPFYIQQPSYVTVESRAIFGEIAYNFTDATKLTVGLRYTDEESTFEKNSFVQVTGGTGNGVAVFDRTTIEDVCAAVPECDSLTKEFEEPTWRVVLDHRFSADYMAYISYNRGFKSGVYNISSISPATVLPTEPEIIDAYEVGFKGSFLDGRLSLNTSVYMYDYKDMQVAITDPATNTQFSANAAKASISGMEIETAFQVTDNLLLNAGLATFFEAEYDEFADCDLNAPNGAGNSVIAGDCTGKRLPATPDITFHLSGMYTIPLASGSRIEVGGLYSFVDSYQVQSWGDYPAGFVDFEGSTQSKYTEQESYSNLNLSTTWYSPDESLSLQLWGRNLLNEDRFRNLSVTPFGFQPVYNREKTFGVTLGYSW